MSKKWQIKIKLCKVYLYLYYDTKTKIKEIIKKIASTGIITHRLRLVYAMLYFLTFAGFFAGSAFLGAGFCGAAATAGLEAGFCGCLFIGDASLSK